MLAFEQRVHRKRAQNKRTNDGSPPAMPRNIIGLSHEPPAGPEGKGEPSESEPGKVYVPRRSERWAIPRLNELAGTNSQ